MRWLWKRAQRAVRPAKERSVTPADVADLAAARLAREQVQRATAAGASRWPTVNATVARLREIRSENHLAADLHVIFTSRD